GIALWGAVAVQLFEVSVDADAGLLPEFPGGRLIQIFGGPDEAARESPRAPEGVRPAPDEQDAQFAGPDREDRDVHRHGHRRERPRVIADQIILLLGRERPSTRSHTGSLLITSCITTQYESRWSH